MPDEVDVQPALDVPAQAPKRPRKPAAASLEPSHDVRDVARDFAVAEAKRVEAENRAEALAASLRAGDAIIGKLLRELQQCHADLVMWNKTSCNNYAERRSAELKKFLEDIQHGD